MFIHFRRQAGVAILLIASFVPALFCSCGKRPKATTTPQMDIAAEFWVRVLLFRNAQKLELAADVVLNVFDAVTSKKLARLTSDGGPFMVTGSEGKINIAVKDCFLSPL